MIFKFDKARETVPFTIKIDSREKSPYRFVGIKADGKEPKSLIVPTEYALLPTGDYVLEVGKKIISVERKSLPDFVGTLARERDRFVRELERLAELDSAHVVIESTWREITERSHEFSSINPKSLFRSVISWTLKFPTIHWWQAGDRFFGERITFRLIEKFHKEETRNMKDNQR